MKAKLGMSPIAWWNEAPAYPSYTPYGPYAWNPVGGAMNIRHIKTGEYTVTWTGVVGEIRVYGNVQVTAYGEGDAQCKADASLQNDGAHIQCFAANGVPMDALFTVLLGS